MLLTLLKVSLNHRQGDAVVWSNEPDERDWNECNRIAVEQGVMALAWGGIEKLPPQMQPPRLLKLKWGLAAEKYAEKYHKYCHAVSELSAFYQAHGIATAQLKGVGFSSYYPTPAYREGGDIDIYTYPLDGQAMSQRQANRLADKLMEQQGVKVDRHSAKHSNFYYKGIPVENHNRFLNTENYRLAHVVEQSLNRVFQVQPTALCGGKYPILTPSAAFNTLFISFHALQHYGSGISLHHLCDWACLLNNCGLHLPEEVKDKHYIGAVAALTHLCNELLGTGIDIDGFIGQQLPGVPTPEYKKTAQTMLHEMLNPCFDRDLSALSKPRLLLYKTKYLWHRLGYMKEVFGEPRWRGVIVSIIAHLRAPSLIFQT